MAVRLPENGTQGTGDKRGHPAQGEYFLYQTDL